MYCLLHGLKMTWQCMKPSDQTNVLALSSTKTIGRSLIKNKYCRERFLYLATRLNTTGTLKTDPHRPKMRIGWSRTGEPANLLATRQTCEWRKGPDRPVTDVMLSRLEPSRRVGETYADLRASVESDPSSPMGTPKGALNTLARHDVQASPGVVYRPEQRRRHHGQTCCYDAATSAHADCTPSISSMGQAMSDHPPPLGVG